MSRGNSDDLAALLRTRIREGAWGEDQRMPTERALAEELGVARNTIRRALGRLEEEGVVARHVGRGTYVRSEQARSALHDTVERLEQASPADMMALRLLLEPAAAELAATNASTAEIAGIREAHQAAKAAFGMPDFERWDADLHRRIFACTRNGLLHEIHEILSILRRQPQWFEMKRRSFSEARRQAYCDQHEAMVVAIENRLPADARDAMRGHLLAVRGNLLGR